MATTQVADIPQNILDIYSQELILTQLPRLHFRNFVNEKTEAGLQPGEKIKFISLDELPAGGKLTEGVPIPHHKITGGDVFITMDEFGNGTKFSRKARTFSIRNLMEDATTLLGRDFVKVQDEDLRDAHLASANKWFTIAAGDTGSATGDVTSPFDSVALEGIVERAHTLNLPKLERGADQFYAFIGHPHQIRTMRASAGWQNARQYVNPEQMLNGEAGRLDDVVFMQTTQMPILSAAGSGGIDVYRGVLIGANAVGLGLSVPMEIIPDPVEDHGRVIPIAWYSIWGVDIVNDYLIEIQTS